MHRLQNRLAEARVELEKATELDRNDAGARLQLGIALLFSGEPGAALPHLQQALRLTPGVSNVHFYYLWLGLDYLLMNDVDHAIEYLRRACTEAPQVAGYHLTLAAALGLKGNIDEAKRELAAASKNYPPTLAKLLDLPNFHDVGSPKFVALRKKTFEAGLLAAGMPAE